MTSKLIKQLKMQKATNSLNPHSLAQLPACSTLQLFCFSYNLNVDYLKQHINSSSSVNKSSKHFL